MITGDYAGTAVNITSEIRLKNPEQVITGPELDSMEREELRRRFAPRTSLPGWFLSRNCAW